MTPNTGTLFMTSATLTVNSGRRAAPAGTIERIDEEEGVARVHDEASAGGLLRDHWNAGRTREGGQKYGFRVAVRVRNRRAVALGPRSPCQRQEDS